MMNCLYLKSKFQIIDKAIEKARGVGAEDPQIGAMFGGYLVVLISGIYEDCVEHLFTQRAGKTGDDELKNFVSKLIDKQFRNPKYEKIIDLLRALDNKYVESFEENIVFENRSALDSIVTNKNDLAHGKCCNATIKDVGNYYERSIKIFEVLEKILL